MRNAWNTPELLASAYIPLSLSLSFSLPLFLSLSLTSEQVVHTLFTGQRKRDKEREGRE